MRLAWRNFWRVLLHDDMRKHRRRWDHLVIAWRVGMCAIHNQYQGRWQGRLAMRWMTKVKP